MSDITRLDFMKSTAGAAAGATVLGALVTAKAEADAEHHAGSEPIVAYVRNPGSGEVTVMSRDREVVLRDRKLAARIARAVA